MAQVLLGEKVYLLVVNKDFSPEDPDIATVEPVILQNADTNQQGIVFFTERDLLRRFKRGEYMTPEFRLMEMTVPQAEAASKLARADGAETLIVLPNKEDEEGFSMGLVTAINQHHRVFMGRA